LGKRIQVIVADDHPLFRGAVQDAVMRSPELQLVATADGGRAALEEIRRLQPDVAVLDLRMPDVDGGQVLDAVVQDRLATRVLFLSTCKDRGTVHDLLARGAAGYLDKLASAEEVRDAIVAVFRGETVLS
jgi:two-component system nitrate/nitrite response regulator NarL